MPLKHHIIANSRKLMNTGPSTHKTVAAYFYMPAEHNVVRHHVAVSDAAIMAHMGAYHKEIFLADDRVFAFGQAAVNGDMLPDGIIRAYDDAAFGLRIEIDGLWVSTDDCTGPDSAIFSDSCVAQQMNVGMDFGSTTNGDLVFNDSECTNFDIMGDVGFRADDGSFVSFQGR